MTYDLYGFLMMCNDVTAKNLYRLIKIPSEQIFSSEVDYFDKIYHWRDIFSSMPFKDI